jgi:RNA polymerase sigma-70 factor (ECF subfamily)
VEAKDAERARDERDPTGPRPAAPAVSAAAVSAAAVSAPSPAAPSADPERAWLDGLRRGDAASFDAVFAAYRRRLYGYLVRMTRRRDVAEDLLQETFLRLAQHAKRLADDTRLGAWLFTVAHRLFVSWTRAQGVRAVLAAEVPPREPAGGDRSPLEAVAASQAQAALERAFAELAPAYREVALLVGVEGLQPAEVAQILGQKPDAVRQRLARARAQLAGALGEHAPAAWRQP